MGRMKPVLAVAAAAALCAGIFLAGNYIGKNGWKQGTNVAGGTVQVTPGDTGQPNPIGKMVERNLEIIISSPKESSNPGDYIKMHQKEYDEIVQAGKPALDYLLERFKNDKDPFTSGLDEWIAAKACNDILGEEN